MAEGTPLVSLAERYAKGELDLLERVGGISYFLGVHDEKGRLLSREETREYLEKGITVYPVIGGEIKKETPRPPVDGRMDHYF